MLLSHIGACAVYARALLIFGHSTLFIGFTGTLQFQAGGRGGQATRETM